jgi:hypothetical protein
MRPHLPFRSRYLGLAAILPLLAALFAAAPADKPLLAHYTFDEVTGATCADSSGHGHNASPEGSAGGLQRVKGLFGNAMSFAGSHLLRVPAKPDFSGLKAVSFSAWTLPTDLSDYREIFRKEDGDQRVLFSFQGDGTILSLGLNIGGYVECDATIDPAQVLDGRWHHCAATFDGKTMRVYLDGKEMGSRERPGVITAGGAAPGCIGSSSGGENFQGWMDDLRVYSEALTAEEVARLCAEGAEKAEQLVQAAEGDEPKAEVPALAHYTFNEPGLSTVIRDVGGQPALDVQAAAGLPRVRGVHGTALQLAGTHALATGSGPGVTELPAITFAAWTRPTDLSSFREIFRQETDRRLLFSFQENGTILSLGLNIGGYVECDAAIDPARVTDGEWHHCAATFDGRTMRVYLDGRETGSREQPGTIAVDPATPAFIGSSTGTGEHFQGALDDLRVLRAALTPEQISALHQAGRDALARRAQELKVQLEAVYAPRDTFAETLAASRRKVVEGQAALDLDLADVLARQLRTRFPQECEAFGRYTGAAPIDFIAAQSDALQVAQAERLVELMLEYRPLTESQRRNQAPEDGRRWEAAEGLQARLEALKSAAESTRFSPEWVSLILEAGSQVQFRPYVSEAVAPYVRPETPPTRDLTPEEARQALERDWLHQANGDPSPERIRQEIGWTRQLGERLGFAGEEAQDLQALEQQAAALTTTDAELYFRVRRLKRGIAFRNPALTFDKVLFVDMPYPQGSEWPHETRHRLGYMAVPGGRLLALHGLSPAGKLTQLMPQPPLHGSFWRPDVSHDAQKVLFCFKPHNEKSFHLYEIGVDGSGLTQLTDGPYDDLDPIYLPDGQHVLFSTTRGHTYVRCMPPTNAYVLARCDRDGKNVYLVSMNNEPDYLPSVMDDGRVLYTRWEYTDKPLWRAQGLWTMHPDGTQVNTFWGNQSVWPDLLKDARSIPGSRRVMFTGSAHHDWFSGSVGIIDPSRGFNFPDGVTKVTADMAWPESGNGPVDPIESSNYHAGGAYGAYYSPYPLGERDFLVSANRNGKFVLYLMDVDGNRELIYEGTHNILHAIPLAPRPRPPVVPEAVTWPTAADRDRPQEGVIYSDNVYEGAPDALRGKARYLRVLNIDHKTYTYWYQRPYISTGPVVSIVQSDGIKRIIGTVPIEPDGSVAFRAPAGIPLHFQLLDENHRALQTMRSFTGVMPGERRGCLGCHELHSVAPGYANRPLALTKAPQAITPPPWPDTTVSYPRYVRPVLDRYCATCHEGEGDGRKVLDLTPRPGMLGFDDTYALLTGHPTWSVPYQTPENPPPGFGIADTLMVEGYSTLDPQAYRTPEPMTKLSYRSRLIELASSGRHYDVRVDAVSLERLMCWVDTMCPYNGEEEVRAIPDPVFQGVDWLAVRPRIATAPRIARPGPVD